MSFRESDQVFATVLTAASRDLQRRVTSDMDRAIETWSADVEMTPEEWVRIWAVDVVFDDRCGYEIVPVSRARVDEILQEMGGGGILSEFAIAKAFGQARDEAVKARAHLKREQ
jgi:hypothetical protein